MQAGSLKLYSLSALFYAAAMFLAAMHARLSFAPTGG